LLFLWLQRDSPFSFARSLEMNGTPDKSANASNEPQALNADLVAQTEQLKRLNQQLVESDQRLRLAIEAGRVGLWVWNSTDLKNAGDWSPRLKEIFGLPLETEVTHEIFLRCVHPDDRERVNNLVLEALKGVNAGRYETEYRIINPDDGKEGWVAARGQAFLGPSGEAVRFIGTLVDITERKNAEVSLRHNNSLLEGQVAERTKDLSLALDELRRSKAYLAEAQHLSATGSFGWNVTTGELYWSDETFCILGFDKLSKPNLDSVFARIHKDDLSFVKQQLDEASLSQKSFDFEHRLIMPDGFIKYVHVIAKPEKLADGQLEFVGAVMDITEQKLLEKRLRRSERNLAEGQRLTKTGSWVLDYLTGNTECSVETCRIFGFPDPPPFPQYSEFRELLRPEDREAVERGLRDSFETGEPRPIKYIFILPDGTRKNIEAISQPVRDDEGKLKLMGTVMDVTERVKAQEALQKSEAYLTEAQRLSRTGSFSWKPASGEVLWSAEMFRIYGIDPSVKPTSEFARQRIHPDDIGTLVETLRSPLQEGKDLEYEHRLLLPDGTVKWVQMVARAARDELGNLEYIGTLMDVTERTQAAESLRASEKFARGQVEALKSTMDALAMEASPDRLVEHVLRTITTQLGAHSCSVWQREVNNLIGFQFSFEDGRFVTKSDLVLAGIPLTLPMEEFWGWPEVVRTGKPGVIEDIRELPFFSWQERLVSLGVITILIVPMSISGRVDAVISIRFTQKRVFSADELELAHALANQAMLLMQLTRFSAESRESAVIAERNRMARDIHDTLAQGFTGVIMQLEAAKGATVQGNLAEAANRIERASDLARSSLGEARRSVRALRPRSLRAGKLFLALDDLLKRMAEGTNLNAEFQAEGDEASMPSDYEEDLLRITQEALTNAVKHADARNFKATLNIGADRIQLLLVDDGRGFDPQKEHDGFGLIGMKERVDRMGGEFIIRTKQSVGTEILVVLKQRSALKPEKGIE